MSLTRVRLDLRLAARRLAAAPLFALGTIAVIGLSLGVGTGLFGIINSIALQPREFEERPGIVRITWVWGGRETPGYPILPESVSRQIFRPPEIESQSVAGFSREQAAVSVGGEVQTLFTEMIAGHYFKVVEAVPVAGRLLAPNDEAPSAPPVAVVSERYWTSQRNKGIDLLSGTAVIAGRPTTVVGVVGHAFRGLWARPIATDLWLPAKQATVHHAFGRLRDDRTIAQADAELKSRVALEGRYAEHTIGAKLGMSPPAPAGLYLVVASAVALSGVLVAVTGASVANLFLARTSRRRSEIAVRLMLGASERDIRRLVSMELVIVGAASAVVSLWLAQATVAMAVHLLPGADRFVVDLRPDWRLLAYATCTAAITMGLLSVILSRHASRIDALAACSAAEGAGGITPRTSRDRNRLVGIQVAGSILLLILASVIVRAASDGLSYARGFEPKGGAVGWLNHGHHGHSPEQGQLIQTRLLRVFRDISGSGIGSLAAASALPVRRGMRTQATGSSGTMLDVGLTGVTAHFFEAFGIELRAGRSFVESDVDGHAPVAVINEDAALHLWPAGRPVGRALVLKTNASGGWRSAPSLIPSAIGPRPKTTVTEKANVPTTFTVVGVVANTEVGLRGRTGESHVFVPLSRLEPSRLAVLARATDGEAASLRLLRTLIKEAGSDLSLEDIGPIDEAIDGSRGGRAGMGRVLGAVGILAALIAVLGVNGVVAHLVSHRFRECGVLLSLGASKANVVRRMTVDVVRTVCIGAFGGVLAAVPCCLLLRRYIWSLNVGDWMLIGAIPVVFGLLAIAAAALPVIAAVRRPVTVLLRA